MGQLLAALQRGAMDELDVSGQSGMEPERAGFCVFSIGSRLQPSITNTCLRSTASRAAPATSAGLGSQRLPRQHGCDALLTGHDDTQIEGDFNFPPAADGEQSA